MRKLKAITTPLGHLSYRGSLPKARVESGYFRETARLERFSEELFRIPLWDSSTGDEPKQLCISNPDLTGGEESVHLLSVGTQTFGLVSYFLHSSPSDNKGGNGQPQEERVYLGLGDSIPGGGAWGTQVKCFGLNQVAMFLPTWDTVFLFSPRGGRCDTIRLGKNSSVFSPRKTKMVDTLMYVNESQTELIFCGSDALRLLNERELLTLELPTSIPCTIKPIGNDEFLVEQQHLADEENNGASRLALISRSDTDRKEFVWQPISVENLTSDAREWSVYGKLARTSSSYVQTLRPHYEGKERIWDVLISPRASSAMSALFAGGKWGSSKSVLASASKDGKMLEVVDFASQKVKTIDMPPLTPRFAMQEDWLPNVPAPEHHIDQVVVSESERVYVLSSISGSPTNDSRGPNSHSATRREYFIRAFETKQEVLDKSLVEWKRIWGLPPDTSPRWKTIQDDSRGEATESKTPPKASNPKHGKIDDLFHAGGNTFAGGTGGSDTAGLGGRGGPYRLDKGHKIHQISDELKQQVDKEVLERARQLGKVAWEERLKEIRMDSRSHEAYMEARMRVEADLDRLKAVLETSSMMKKERYWEKNQAFGELDDSRLVDGLVGERLIYKRRVLREPPPGSSASSAVNVRIVVDVSASMYRFQSMDGRLQRMIDTTLMLLEAMEGVNHRFRVSLYGHSGESPAVPLVEWDNVPQDEGAIYKVLETMAAHAQYCLSGDHTVDAVYSAAEAVLDEDPESGGLVIVVSDANLRRYGIAPSELAKAMTVSDKVNAHVIFIASMRDEAETLVRELPFGKAKVCLETSDLPHVMRDILSDASQAQ